LLPAALSSDSVSPMRGVVITSLIIAGVLVLLPPFFTRGACTAEFDAASDEIERARSQMASLELAETYLRSRTLPYSVLSAQRCESFPPPGVESCPGGPLLLVEIPIKNRVCRYYRDDSVHVQLGYNQWRQLVRLQTDMNPYHTLKSSLLGLELNWGK
jgi:hypothetical protein